MATFVITSYFLRYKSQYGSHIIYTITLTYPVIFIGLINVRCAATAEQKTGHHTGHSLYRSTTPLLFVRS